MYSDPDKNSDDGEKYYPAQIFMRIFLAFITAGVLFSSTALATSFPAESHMQKMAPTASIGAITFPPGTEFELLNKNNMPTGYIILNRGFVLNGISLRKGTALWVAGPKVHLISFTSVAGQRINGIILPTESTVNFDERQNLKMINPSETLKINGLLYEDNHWINFYPSGLVESGFLKIGKTIKKLNIRSGDIEFFENGNIKKASINKSNYKVNISQGVSRNIVVTYKIELWHNGNIRKTSLYDRSFIQGKECQSGDISFNISGKLNYCN